MGSLLHPSGRDYDPEGERPVKKNLQGNIFTGKIVRIVEKGAEHTLFFKQSQDDYDFEISMSNLAY